MLKQLRSDELRRVDSDGKAYSLRWHNRRRIDSNHLSA
jgi:hypothetical protein